MGRLQKNAERIRRYVDLLKPRRRPDLPVMAVRHLINDESKLQQLERLSADGVSFVPEARLPPWKRQSAFKEITGANDGEIAPRLNFKGFKVRVASPGQGQPPGFPTHFQ